MMATSSSSQTSSSSLTTSSTEGLFTARGNESQNNVHNGHNDDDDNYKALKGPPHGGTSSAPLNLRTVFAESAQHNKIMHNRSTYYSTGSSARSVSSYTTQWSTITDPISNTTQRLETNKKRKIRFLQFTKILMKLLERFDPALHRNARSMIKDCEERKKRGEVQSMTDTLKRPLKEVVGPKYWKLAREREKEANIHHLFHLDVEPLDVTATSEVPQLGEHDLSVLLDTLQDDAVSLGPTQYSDAPTMSAPYGGVVVDDLKTRKKRLWMIICILMKYLDRTDKDLYSRAKTVVSDCVRRHRLKEEGYRSLSGSIQSSLKREIGSDYWRRAEHYVGRRILNRIESSSSSCCCSSTTSPGANQQQSSSSSTSHISMKKRTIDGSRVRFEDKRPRRVYEI